MSEDNKLDAAAPSPAAEAAAALGALLRQAREARGCSVGEAAERLKFSAKQVEAVEAGHYQGLREPVFIKGFLHSYGRFVGVDAVLIQEHIRVIFPDEGMVAAPAVAAGSQGLDYRDTPLRKPLPKWIFALLLLAVAGAAIYAWQSKSSADNARHSGGSGQSMIGEVAMPNIDGGNVTVVPMGEASAAATASAPTTASASQGEQLMVVKLRYRSTLHVVDANGKILFSQVVPAGSEHRFDSGAPYQVTVGYALGASLSFNGEDVPLASHIQNKTATLTVGGSGSAHE